MKDLKKVKDHLFSILNIDSKTKIAPNFFNITYSGMIDCVYNEIARLYDSTKGAKSIPKLLQQSCKYIDLLKFNNEDQEKLKILNKKLNKDGNIKRAIKIIWHRRNKIWAHNDEEFFSKEGKDDIYYLPNYEIEELISFTEGVLKLLTNRLAIDCINKPRYDKDLDNLFK